jgi:hypothetical protein
MVPVTAELAGDLLHVMESGRYVISHICTVAGAALDNIALYASTPCYVMQA